MIDCEDNKGQVFYIQKVSLKFGFRLMVAWGLKDAKELVDDFAYVF